MRSGRVRSAVSEGGEFAELAKEKQIFPHRGGKKDRRRKGKIDHSWSKRRLGDVLVSVGGSSLFKGLFALSSRKYHLEDRKRETRFPFLVVSNGTRSGRRGEIGTRA